MKCLRMHEYDYRRINDPLCFQHCPASFITNAPIRPAHRRQEKITYHHEFDHHAKSRNADRLSFNGSIFRFDRSKNAYWTPPLGSFLPMDVRFCVLGYSSQYRQFCELRILIS